MKNMQEKKLKRRNRDGILFNDFNDVSSGYNIGQASKKNVSKNNKCNVQIGDEYKWENKNKE